MQKLLFTATVEKDGRIVIPTNIRKKFEIKHDDFLLVLAGRYEDMAKDFIHDAFKEAID